MDRKRGQPLGDSPWYSYLTIDLVWHVLKRSIFHWFIAWMIPLSIVSLGRSVYHPVVISTCLYATLVDLITVFSVVDERLAYGTSKHVNLRDEVVVITGGANGLGLVMAQMLGMKGAAVAVLDVEELDDSEIKGVEFFKCDVADSKQIQKAAGEIRKALGTPTILINNAGVVNAKPLFDMSDVEVDHTYRVNTLSHFQTIRTFLPDMLSEGHGCIVTVSSVLGHLGCANLAAYSSTKSALLTMHASLRSDLRHLARTNEAARDIKTVLVTPGQLNTRMFSSVRTPSRIFAPVVEPVHLAKEVVRFVEEGRSGEIGMPLYVRLVGWMGVVPAGVRELLKWAVGMDGAMEAALMREKGAQQ